MTHDHNHDHAVPDVEERRRLNAQLLTHGVESSLWDDKGRPAPWPDDIEGWIPSCCSSDAYSATGQQF